MPMAQAQLRHSVDLDVLRRATEPCYTAPVSAPGTSGR
jgi:hypothetical protein